MIKKDHDKNNEKYFYWGNKKKDKLLKRFTDNMFIKIFPVFGSVFYLKSITYKEINFANQLTEIFNDFRLCILYFY